MLAGESAAVAREGSRLCAEAWSYRVPACANLVVGTIEGDAAEQSWDNVGRALAAMAAVVDQEGAMVLCTDLSQRPGRASNGSSAPRTWSKWSAKSTMNVLPTRWRPWS